MRMKNQNDCTSAVPVIRNGIISTPEPDSQFTRDFFKIAAVSTAIGFGCGVGSLQALHWDASGLSFQVSVWTFLASAVGAGIALIYWRLVRRSESAGRWGSLLLAVCGI